MTISEANKKTLRPAMDVICGIRAPLEDILEITIESGSYDGVVGDVENPTAYTPLMDLSNGGFQNDGTAIPLDADHSGIVSDTTGRLELTVAYTGTLFQRLVVLGYVNGKTRRWEFPDLYFSPETVTIEAESRIIVSSMTIGYAWQFDNSNLVSCNLSLRGVESNLEDPSLPQSEIVIQAYEPNDITDDLAKIVADYPIWYSAGYPGDMSPIRHFYLDDVIGYKDNIIEIRGIDATKFLDGDYVGRFLGDTSDVYTGSINGLVKVYDAMLTDSGIDHEFINELDEDADFNVSTDGILIQQKSKRDMLAEATNLLNFDMSDWYKDNLSMRFRYVDAGLPKLSVTYDDAEVSERIENFCDYESEITPIIRTISINNPTCKVLASESITTETIQGTVIGDTSDPYYSFSASAGTISQLSPYAYKVYSAASRDITISGRKISLYDPTEDSMNTPLVYHVRDDYGEWRKVGRDIVLRDWIGMTTWNITEGESFPVMNAILEYMAFSRGKNKVKFKWRGNPKLQPSDRIIIDNGDIVAEGFIESMTLNHENGGLTSEIVLGI